jgi:predicted nicotinamide N-methyase
MTDQKKIAKTFEFQYFDKDKVSALKVKIYEHVSNEYGMFVWPSSLLLAQYLAETHSNITGLRVLELGCGVALPGIVAAKFGAKVILTDAGFRPDVLQNCREGCSINRVQCDILPLTWGKFSSSVLTMTAPELLIGADVFYDIENIETILATGTCDCREVRLCVVL